MAKCVWALSDPALVHVITQTREPNARCWIFTLLDSLPHDSFGKALVTMWSIWHARRKAIHEHQFQSPQATNCFIHNYLSDLQAIKPNPKPSGHAFVRSGTRARWLAPSPRTAKIKVNGAVSRSSHMGSFSAVCRDDT